MNTKRMNLLKSIDLEYILSKILPEDIIGKMIIDWIDHSNIPRQVKDLLIIPYIKESIKNKLEE